MCYRSEVYAHVGYRIPVRDGMGFGGMQVILPPLLSLFSPHTLPQGFLNFLGSGNFEGAITAIGTAVAMSLITSRAQMQP